MSNSTATRQRPLSPHLFIYKPIPTMVMSIMHRITGGALYFGTLLVAWWLIATSISREQFDIMSLVYGSLIGQIVLFGYTWALVHHMIGGIRHLVWDTGTGLEKETSTKIAWVTIVLSIILAIVIWIAGHMVRGA